MSPKIKFFKPRRSPNYPVLHMTRCLWLNSPTLDSDGVRRRSLSQVVSPIHLVSSLNCFGILFMANEELVHTLSRSTLNITTAMSAAVVLCMHKR
ncbi:hypothetical protein GOP47_0001564 [Adiantum capillus-veneris]|uniref:Uncharacterized protein n=1 Tax=Adiantum capillus-veneris TaxID=13818 RepID=A0A9D4ZQ57_ADICA|nr:hypothetical protein GOP47_0001564 [Adiantum capillus-veneris]